VVRVTIVGEEYAIRSDAPPEHTRAVAEYVDRAIRAVMHGSVVEPHKAAILAALQITDELFEATASSRVIEGNMDALSEEVRRWLPPAKRGASAVAPSSVVGLADGGAGLGDEPEDARYEPADGLADILSRDLREWPAADRRARSDAARRGDAGP
jgi:cell division protein ZapA